MPTMPTGAAAGAHRQEQPLGARQRVGPAARAGDRLSQAHLRRGDGRLHRALSSGGYPRLDGDRAVLRQQHDHPDLQHQRRSDRRGRPQDVVERAGAGELAAEGVERFDCAHAPMRRDRLRAARAGDIRDDDGDRA